MNAITEFRFVNKLKSCELAEYLGISKGFMSRIESGGNKLPKAQLYKILNNDRGWDTSALLPSAPNVTAVAKGNSKASVTIGSHNKIKVEDRVETMENNLVPIIPTSARAGVMGDYSDGVTIDQCEMISSPMGGATCAIRIYGDSMEPKFPSGALAFLRKIDPNIYIEWGRTYVLDTPNGAVMKCIEQSDEPDKVTCVSLNEKYKSYDVPMSGILGWYRVLGAIIFD